MTKYRKPLLVFVFFLFISGFVFASTYTISGYRFNINGKTKEETVRNLIVPRSTENFKSESALEKALEQKRQTLINSRLFFEDEIFYTYETEPSGGDNYNVFVQFVVTDAKSALLLPYPQYDSNTGLSLGLRYKDRNFMGLGKEMSVVFDAEQNDNSFKKGDYYLEIPVEKFRIGKTDYSGDFELNLNFGEKSKDYIALELAESNFKLGNMTLPADIELDYNFFTKKFRQLGYGVAVNGINLGSDIKLDLSDKMFLDWNAVSDSYMNIQANFKNIKFGNVIFTNRILFRFEDKTGTLNDYIEKDKIDDAVSVNFTGKLSALSASTLLSYNFDYDSKRGDMFQTTTAVNYKFNPIYTASLGFITKKYEKGGWYSLDPYEKVTMRSSVAGKIPFVLSLAEHNEVLLEEDKVDFYFASTLSSSYGTIDYVGNFRKGTQYSVTGQLDYHPWKEKRPERTDYKIKMDLTSFPFAIKWLNPSVRFSLVASSKSTYWADNSDWRLDKDDIQALFRGIQTKSPYVQQAYSKSSLVCAVNLNIVSSMFVFEDFGKTYLNLFVDAGAVRAKGIDKMNKKRDYKILTSVGMEVIAIMDSHPSYPIRVSFGVDTETFKDKFISKKDDAKLDYEVYIGLGWLY